MNKIKLYINGEKPKNINPYTYKTELDLWVMGCIYQGVKMYNENLNLVNRLTEKIIKNKKNKEIILKFKDINWSNNEKISSLDYKFSVELLCSKYSMWNVSKFYKKIAGFEEYIKGINLEIEGLEILDNKSLKIKFIEWSDNYEKSLILPIISKKEFFQYDSKEFFSKSFEFPKVGCGPYLINYIDDEKISFIRNATFHLGTPNIEKMEIYYGDEEKQLKLIKNKEIDFTVISYKKVKEIEKDYKIYPLDILKTTILEINNEKILNNINIRKYLNRIIPRDLIVKEIYFGYAEKINQCYPKIICEKFNIPYYIENKIEYENKELKNQNLIIGYIIEEHLEIVKIIKQEFLKFSINIEVKKYANLKEAKLNSDFILLDLNHQILANSNSYIRKILDEFIDRNNYNKQIKEFNNILNLEHSIKNLKDISKFVNDYLPFIPLISHKEIQIINNKISGIKYDPRGILANIQNLKIKGGQL